MAKYQCSVCGYIFDEEREGKSLEDLQECPVCHQSKRAFEPVRDAEIPAERKERAAPLDYPEAYSRRDESVRYMKEIHQMAVSGSSIIDAMGTRLPVPGWDEILLLGAQLNPMPLDEYAPVNTTTVIGKHAEKPLVLENPVYISHMSFGALSRETKVALAMGSAMAGSAMCSGEGGILPEEMAAADKYIFEYVPNRYSVTPEHLRDADAIEIKIGQGDQAGHGRPPPRGKGDAGDRQNQEQAAGTGRHQPVPVPGD